MNILKIVFKALSLGGKMIMSLPKITLNKRKGIQAFKKELENMGFDNDTIKSLTKNYASALKLSNMMNNKKETIN